MDELIKNMNWILFETDKNRWISLSKDSPKEIFKAKDKLRAFKLIERQGKYSWRLTQSGYEAVELGGFNEWQENKKSLKTNLNSEKQINSHFEGDKGQQIKNDVLDQKSQSTTVSSNLKEVFVTYSWDSEEFKTKVLSFADFLREEGFETDIDRKISQQSTATDFTEMMHKAMTDYEKVIVVLSEGYKKKADSFAGGVGQEYSLIIKDIDQNPNKYVLVSMQAISDDIFPLSFKGREVIDLSNEENYNVLFSKLQNEPQINFSPVGKEKPKIKTKPIPKFKELMGVNKKSTKSNGAKVHLDIGIQIDLNNPADRKVTLNVSITNLEKETRYYHSPYFKLSKKVEFLKGASKQDTFLLFPISELPSPLKLEYGQKTIIDYDVPPQQLEIYEKLNNNTDFIQVFVSTTLDEKHSSNKLIITEFIEKYKEFMDAEIE